MTSFDSIYGQWLVLISVLCVGMLLVLWAIRPTLPNGVRRSRRQWQQRSPRWHAKLERRLQRRATNAPPLVNAGEQLKAVMAAPFTKQRVLSISEARVLKEAECAIAKLRMPWRVMAQVSLGEVLRSPHTEAFAAINSKRVDLLIVDENHDPIAAVEYQGVGHWQGSGAARDAVKKEALRRAGVAYIEILAGAHLPIDLHREIEHLTRPVLPALA
jgi:Protein of unknown function (DUF2726)